MGGGRFDHGLLKVENSAAIRAAAHDRDNALFIVAILECPDPAETGIEPQVKDDGRWLFKKIAPALVSQQPVIGTIPWQLDLDASCMPVLKRACKLAAHSDGNRSISVQIKDGVVGAYALGNFLRITDYAGNMSAEDLEKLNECCFRSTTLLWLLRKDVLRIMLTNKNVLAIDVQGLAGVYRYYLRGLI